MLSKFKSTYQILGLQGVLRSIVQKVFSPPLPSFQDSKSFFEGKTGLEIGGPSSIFRNTGQFPVYRIAKKIDGCNFSPNTIWEGQITQGLTFNFNKTREPGMQYIAEATDLSFVPANKKYDFILAFHVIEHIANPIKAIKDWIRILKKENILVLGIPHKENTFDHLREVTSLSHLISDFENNITESDTTHLEEVLEFHDYSRDFYQISKKEFIRQVENNFRYRVVHHHVFNTELAIKLLDFIGMQILSVDVFLPWHILIIAKKLSANCYCNNAKFLSNAVEYTQISPFKIDHLL